MKKILRLLDEKVALSTTKKECKPSEVSFNVKQKYYTDNPFKHNKILTNEMKDNSFIMNNLFFKQIRNIDIGSNYRIHNFSWSNESLNAKEIIVKVNYHQRQDHLRKKREEYTNLFISTIENKLKEEKNE